MIYVPNITQATEQAARTSSLWLSLPFDLARQQYASAVRAGLIEASMLAGAQFERALGSMEKAALGPWARRV